MTESPVPRIFDAAEAMAAVKGRAWPFEEARKLVERVEKRGGGTVLFETGYGPSGLPHIGTFGEVARTTMVRHAFRVMTEDRYETRLLCFSDDMDGMRKVPENVPNRDMLMKHLGKPLTRVPDPFGTHDSFGGHNNAMLRGFLDHFGFEYEFASATDYYAAGRFDAILLKMLSVYDQVMEIMLPTLREERRKTYSPFLPVCPRTGVVLQVPVLETHPLAGTIVYRDPETEELVETPVTGGRVKAQWKPDWAMRWAALGVDYEMSGKDHIDNVRTSGKICRALGAPPPDGFNYELFLDENGEKISKSKGNGLTIEQWLTYASPESLSLFMYQKPKAAKKLHFDVIPRAVDDYYTFLGKYPAEKPEAQIENPVWHIHSGHPPAHGVPVSFTMLLNLVSASNAEDAGVLWGFLSRYAPGASPQSEPELDRLVGYAIRYFADFVKPGKVFRKADETETSALQALDAALAALSESAHAEEIQNAVYEVGRLIYPDAAKPGPDGRPGVALTWFSTLYRLLLGQERGPRFGSFVALYGIPETRALIRAALAR